MTGGMEPNRVSLGQRRLKKPEVYEQCCNDSHCLAYPVLH